jgi:uncharacterized membrane protein
MKSCVVSVACALTALLAGCGKDPIKCEPTSETVTYVQVKPIFDAVCTNCHSTTLVTSDERDDAPKDINFNTYADAVADGEDGAKEVIDRKMPSDDPDKITKEEACLIKAWVDQGMLEQ